MHHRWTGKYYHRWNIVGSSFNCLQLWCSYCLGDILWIHACQWLDPFVEISRNTCWFTELFMGAGFRDQQRCQEPEQYLSIRTSSCFHSILSGTFFSEKHITIRCSMALVETLPLTALNDTLRKISFEGAHLYNCVNNSASWVFGASLYTLLPLKFSGGNKTIIWID